MVQGPSKSARVAYLTAAAARLRDANSVVVVGGGYVGVELAAEVVGKYASQKKVTLVSASDW